MKKLRSSKKVEAVASDLYDLLLGPCSKLNGVGYTFDADGYIIVLYHHGVSKKARERVTMAGKYRVKWIRTAKVVPA